MLQQTLCSEILEECRFAVKCWGPSEKTVRSAQLNGRANIEDNEAACQALKSDFEMDTGFT